MPSGKTHDRITLWCLPGVGIATLAITRDPQPTLIVSGAFLFSGLMFGPDLDIYSIQYKRWGCFRWLWLPYQKMLRHRSGFSHGPLIGTILRIIYLSGCLGAIAVMGIALAQLIGNFSWNWRTWTITSWNWLLIHWEEALALFLGLELGAMSHTFSDWLGSTCRVWRKKGFSALFSRPKKQKRRKSSRPKKYGRKSTSQK